MKCVLWLYATWRGGGLKGWARLGWGGWLTLWCEKGEAITMKMLYRYRVVSLPVVVPIHENENE